MKFRVRHGVPLGLLVVVAATLFHLEKLPMEGATVPRAVLWTAAACWFVFGVGLRARAWRIVDTPTSKVAAATVGTCELSGTAIAIQRVAARASGSPSVWYKWELQEYRGSGKNAHWATVDSWEERHPFTVADDTGSMRVDPAGAEFNGFETHRYPVAGRGRRWRQMEWLLPDRATVYLLAPVRADASGTALEVGGPAADDFVISDDSERRVALRFSAWAWVSLLLGLGAVIVAPYVLLREDAFGDRSLVVEEGGAFDLAAAAAAVYLAALAASWLLRAYNRLVIVRNQAERAWASIEVQLQRRCDLIGNLLAVVRGYVDYESTVQPGLAAARARGALPDDTELVAAEGADAAAHADAQQLLALAEAYPTLRGDGQFERLAEALRDAENRIALARTFYNDAINVMRDRRGTFPYLMVAPLVSMPSLELFETANRDAVAVGI